VLQLAVASDGQPLSGGVLEQPKIDHSSNLLDVMCPKYVALIIQTAA
jgi:hypothetical protein